jgi:hypothetical protein
MLEGQARPRRGRGRTRQLLPELCRTKLHTGIKLTPIGVLTAQGIGGARSGRGAGPQAMLCGGTPAKPGFLQSKKCAQIILCKEKYYTRILLIMMSIICGHSLPAKKTCRHTRRYDGWAKRAARNLRLKRRSRAHSSWPTNRNFPRIFLSC